MVTDRMVADLVGREFGEKSAEYCNAKSIAIDSVLSKSFDYARYAKQFSTEDRQKVDTIIRAERKRYSRAEIWSSDITTIRKILLVAPRCMAMLPINIFDIITR